MSKLKKIKLGIWKVEFKLAHENLTSFFFKISKLRLEVSFRGKLNHYDNSQKYLNFF